MPIPQSCIEALLIEFGLSLPYAFRYKKPGFLPRSPLSPREWAAQLFVWNCTVYWNLLCLLCLFRRAGPSPKVRAFSNSGWPDSDKSCGSIACPYSTILCPYSQKNRRTIIRDVQIETTSNHMHYRNFGNVHFAGSTLGNGLSGEPWCGKIAVWQLCRERQPLWNSHYGLNLTCLDQCHGVRSHSKSFSQSWRKRIIIQQSEFSL